MISALINPVSAFLFFSQYEFVGQPQPVETM
ncbi:MAG: hypothetical protein JWO06_3901, partial [Bacteroidota bacterium]|nr:hypothetical protein [Bacteroidota bacterium]